MYDSRSSSIRWQGGLGAAVLAAALVLAYTGLQGPPCLSRLLLHMPCPGCGFTRSLESLWRGHLIASLRYHPLGILVFGACWFMALRAATPRAYRDVVWRPFERVERVLARPYGQFGLLALLLGAWLVRLALSLSGNHFFIW